MQQGWARALTLPGVLIGLVVTWWLWPSPPRLYVAEVRGSASVDRVGAEGPVDAVEGTSLQAQDELKTSANAEAVLQYGEGSEIRVGPTSSVEVAAIDEEGVSLELGGGLVRAIVRPDSGPVRIGNNGRGVVATDATFDVGVADDILQVRALEGSVDLEGMDQERLAEGEEAIVRGRTARVGTAPTSLLLSVRPPQARRTAAKKHVVRGQTAPAAQVVLRGPEAVHRIRADGEGRFEVPVDLAEGDNEVVVEVTDVFGASTSTTAALPVLDTKGPRVSSDVEYD